MPISWYKAWCIYESSSLTGQPSSHSPKNNIYFFVCLFYVEGWCLPLQDDSWLAVIFAQSPNLDIFLSDTVDQVGQSLYICFLIPGASLASESKPVIRNESTYKYIFWVECPTIKPFKMVNYLFVPQYYNQNPLVGMWYPIFSNIEISSFYPTGWQYWQHVCNGTREHCQLSQLNLQQLHPWIISILRTVAPCFIRKCKHRPHS